MSKKEQKELETIERGIRVIEMRKSGASYRAIAKKLREQGVADVSYQTVRRDCKAALKVLRKHREEEAEEYFELQVERAESLFLANWVLAIGKSEKLENGETKTTKPSISAGWLALAIWRELNDLLGYKAAQRHEITGAGGDPIQTVALSLSDWRKQAAERREQAAKTQEMFEADDE